MAFFNGSYFGAYKTAKEIIDNVPGIYGQDGYYFVYPNGRDNPGRKVYCDMTTDGGGWMLIARTHPGGTATAGTWGWQGPEIGAVDDFSGPYQAGWWNLWNSGSSFTEFAYGNRKNINTNEWGPFIYKKTSLPGDFLTNDSQRASSTVLLASNTSVYNYTGAPSMQAAIGFPSTGTTNNNYYIRDCCGYSDYGLNPWGLKTTYCNDPARQSSPGPWCNGDSYDGNGDFLQGGTLYDPAIHGGTRQAMIMVR